MKKRLIISQVLLLLVPSYFLANGFVACCDDHVDTVNAYLNSMKDLVAKVKTENLAQFYRKSHKQEGITYLKFVAQSSSEAVEHYNEMILKADPAIKNLEEFKLSEKAMERLQKKSQQLTGQIKAAKEDKEAKVLIERMNLELK